MHATALQLLSRQLRPGARILDVGSVRLATYAWTWISPGDPSALDNSATDAGQALHLSVEVVIPLRLCTAR